MTKTLRRLLAASFIALALTASAEPPPVDLKAVIESRFPHVKVTQVVPSAIPGWYEVITPEHLAYTNADGSLLFTGSVVDTRTREDLTARRWSDLHRIDFESLPFNLAIKVVHGDGRRKLVVFADPLCPFCKQLEQQLQDVPDISVFTFLNPIESLHPGATVRANQIWCAKDRAAAWSQWMLKEVAVASEDCDLQGLVTVRSVASQLKVNSTPALFFEDGHRVVGVISVAELEREFQAANAKRTNQ